MSHDIGLICQECSAITIFRGDVDYPRRCARCHEVEPPPASVRRDASTQRGTRCGPLASSDLEWME
jgi:hypothetical protein